MVVSTVGRPDAPRMLVSAAVLVALVALLTACGGGPADSGDLVELEEGDLVVLEEQVEHEAPEAEDEGAVEASAPDDAVVTSLARWCEIDSELDRLGLEFLLEIFEGDPDDEGDPFEVAFDAFVAREDVFRLLDELTAVALEDIAGDTATAAEAMRAGFEATQTADAVAAAARLEEYAGQHCTDVGGQPGDDDPDVAAAAALDPCAVAAQADLSAVLGAVSATDGPEAEDDGFGGAGKTCMVRGERFDLQLTFWTGQLTFSRPDGLEGYAVHDLDGVGEDAFIELRNGRPQLLRVRDGHLVVWGTLLFAGGNLLEAEEETAQDYEAIARILADALEATK
jgi:hypothetical protein